MLLWIVWRKRWRNIQGRFKKMQSLKHKALVLLLLTIGVNKIKAQTYNSLIPDKDIENFIQWKLTDTSAYRIISKECFSISILSWKKEILDYDNSSRKSPFSIYKAQNHWLDSIITKEDKEFFIQQADSAKSNTWETRGINLSNKTKRIKNVCSLSIPLFSKDKQFAIIRELYRCGKDCGEMRISIYKKTISGWEYSGMLAGGVF